jgi:small subunit ribosomal protein S21
MPLTQAGAFDLFLGFSAKTHLTFIMPIEIKIRKNEPVDRALRRLKKKLERENIIKDVRAKRYNEKPTERRRRKEKVMAFTQMLRDRHAQ